MAQDAEPLFTLDASGHVIGLSHVAARLFGRRARDALGLTVPEFLAAFPAVESWSLRPAPAIPDHPGGPAWGLWQAGDEDRAGLDRAVLEAVFTQSAVGLHVLDPELRVLRVNIVAVGMRGIPEEKFIGRPLAEAYAAAGVTVSESTLREVLATGRPAHDVLVSMHPPSDSPHERIVSVSAYRMEDRTGQPLGVVATAVDVTDRERAQARLRLLHAAHERIGTSLDVERTARELVDVAVPAFADSILVALTDAVLQGKSPDLLPREAAPVLRCAATGGGDSRPPTPAPGSVLLPGLFGEELPTAPTLLPAGPPGSGPAGGARLVVPLTVRGQIFGVVAFQRAYGSEPYADDDLVLAGGIASRTATCLENALRFTREHVVMTALQSWPLRPQETTLRAVEVAQRHRPGGSGGGSWFDVIPLPGARVGLVVGRVERPGLSAVAAMSRLRTAVHSLTTLDLDPHEVLARLHSTTLRLALEQGGPAGAGEPTASCTFVVHDPVDGRLEAARAGASLFAVVRPDGSVDLDPVAEGPLLGAHGPPFASATLRLPEGSTLCLASAASPDEKDPAPHQVLDALAHPDRGPEDMADDVQALLAADRVLLVARTRLLPEGDLAEWPVPPEGQAVGAARRRVGECLTAWGVSVDPYAVKVVVSELVTNAIRYGAAPITLRLIRGESRLTCEVSDAAPTAPHLRHAKAIDEGGRGLHICASLAANWGVRYVEDGKTVWAEIATEEPG
ncbi:PAS domain-containing protein [Streptomyces vilmorinianum]|uniref:PAS domain-containing protein n=1 Tax=Streptomyces vilmorinianum TaxID=3051092 RepID=UPI0010FADCAF|nr:PAS domain-containing protein [Streptomyces vilmorinianum]